jgi:hypothetical protein
MHPFPITGLFGGFNGNAAPADLSRLRLRTRVAHSLGLIEGGEAMLAEGSFESHATVVDLDL